MMSIVFELIILSISIATNILLVSLALAKNSKHPLNRYFALLGVTLSIWLIVNYVSTHPLIFDQLTWIRLAMMWAVIMSTALLLLVNVFPTGTSYYSKLGRLIWIPAIIISALTVSPWLFTHVDYSSGQAEPIPGPAMLLFAPYAIGTLILSIYILARRLFSFRGRAKEQVRYALVGVSLTFLGFIFFNFILVIVFHNTLLIALSPALSLIFTGSFAYGIIRHQLFDLRMIVARLIAYLLLAVFAGLAYGLAIVGLSFFIAGVHLNVTQVILSAVVVGCLILFVPTLTHFFNRVTRTIFYQGAYDTKNVLDKLSSILVQVTDTDSLSHSSLNILMEALKPEHITLLLLGDRQKEKKRIITVGPTKPDLSHLTTKQLLTVPDVVVADSLNNQSGKFHSMLQSANVSIVVRLNTQGGMIGYCLFGYKASGAAYNERDIDLIRIACDELAVAIQNTLRFEQIEAFTDTLQQRIEDATKELRESNTQLQKLDEAKDEFVSMASHQLRTPLTSVKGYISMVLEGDAGKISTMQRQLLSEAFTSSERMVHLINDFLNVSRLQTGKFMIEARPADLSKIVAQEVDSLQTTAHAHDLKIRFHKPSYFPMLYLDEGKIRQVLMNFIDNAIYYSHEDTIINVELSIIDGFATVEVHDTGIGVPTSEQPHLFSKFFRATNARRQRPDGTGVGLFLAKKVIDAHGGTIIFHSTEGEGSTFGFRLPIKKLSSPGKNPDKLNN